MKAIELYKFVENYSIEYKWHMGDVLLFIDNRNIPYFYTILDATIFDDDGINCIMKDGYIVFEMKDICNYYDIELSEVFNKEDES